MAIGLSGSKTAGSCLSSWPLPDFTVAVPLELPLIDRSARHAAADASVCVEIARRARSPSGSKRAACSSTRSRTNRLRRSAGSSNRVSAANTARSGSKRFSSRKGCWAPCANPHLTPECRDTGTPMAETWHGGHIGPFEGSACVDQGTIPAALARKRIAMLARATCHPVKGVRSKSTFSAVSC
jgi:hypothetical protein